MIRSWSKALGLCLTFFICSQATGQNEAMLSRAPGTSETAPGLIILSEGFEGSLFPPSGWTNTQISGSGLWTKVSEGEFPTCFPHSGSSMAKFGIYNFAQGTSALLCSPKVEFPVGVKKTLQVLMYRDPGYPNTEDSLGIYYGPNTNLSGAVYLGKIFRYNETSGWFQYSFEVPEAVTGLFRMLIRGTSDYGNNIHIDDVSITAAEAKDAGIYEILYPGYTMLPGKISPKVAVKNYGYELLLNIPVRYQIDGEADVHTEIVDSLAPGATSVVTFPEWTANKGSYRFIFYSDFPDDSYRNNDTMVRETDITYASWESGADIPFVAYLGAAASCGGKIYCMGGNQNEQDGKKVAIYDVATDTWSTGPMLPQPRGVGMGAATSDKVYFIGGRTGANTSHNNIWELTPPDTNWVAKKSLPAAVCWGDAVAYQDSLIYVLGGWGSTSGLKSVFVYNNVINKVRSCTPLPVALFGGAAAITGNKIVYTGGCLGYYMSVSTFVGDINQDDRSLISWTEGADLPWPAFRTDGASWGQDEIIVANGCSGLGWVPESPNPAYAYNPYSDSWRSLPYKTTPTLGSYLGSVISSYNDDSETWKLVVAAGLDLLSENTLVTENLSETFGLPPVGTQNHNAAWIKVSPNPSDNQIFIETTDPALRIWIYNMTGQKVYYGDFNDRRIKINTGHFHDGLYILKAEMKNDIFFSRFLIKHSK